METKRDLFQISNARRSRMFWPAAVVLAGIAAIGAWLAAPLMTKHDAPPIYAPREAGASPMDALGARVKSVEEKLKTWSADNSGLGGRVSQIEKSFTAGIRRARAETTALVESLRREMNRSFEALHSRLEGVESVQRETHDEVARLQSDLAAVRQELAGFREANAQQWSQLGQIQEAQASTQNEVSGLQAETRSNQRKVDALSYQVDRQHVGFEVSRDRSQEVVSGVYLTIKQTNVARQQVGGWIQIAADGRFVWLEDISAQQPVSFAARNDERPYQLVFTRVSEGTASGYLLVPSL